MKTGWLFLFSLLLAVRLQAGEETTNSSSPALPDLPAVSPQSNPQSQDKPFQTENVIQPPSLPDNTNYQLPSTQNSTQKDGDQDWLVNALKEKNAQMAETQGKQDKARLQKILDDEKKLIERPWQYQSSLDSSLPSTNATVPNTTGTASSPFAFSQANSSGLEAQNPTATRPDKSSTQSNAAKTQVLPQNPIPTAYSTSLNQGTNSPTPSSSTPNLQGSYRKISNNPNYIPEGYVTPEERLAKIIPSEAPSLDRQNISNSQVAADTLKQTDKLRHQEDISRPSAKEMNSVIPDPLTMHHY